MLNMNATLLFHSYKIYRLSKMRRFICCRKKDIGFQLAVLLVVLSYGYSGAIEAKSIFEKFRKEYSIITNVCKAFGFVRDTCIARGFFHAIFPLFSLKIDLLGHPLCSLISIPFCFHYV